MGNEVTLGGGGWNTNKAGNLSYMAQSGGPKDLSFMDNTTSPYSGTTAVNGTSGGWVAVSNGNNVQIPATNPVINQGNTGVNGSSGGYYEQSSGGGIEGEHSEDKPNAIKKFLERFMPAISTNVQFDYKMVFLVVTGIILFGGLVYSFASKKRRR